jgi:hypothetical protein
MGVGLLPAELTPKRPFHRSYGSLVSDKYHRSLLSHRMHKFNASIGYTKTLYKVDIRQSIAYSKALARAGILTAEEAVEMERGLKLVEQEWDSGTVSISWVQAYAVRYQDRRRGHLYCQ